MSQDDDRATVELREGNLAAALQAQTEVVRRRPTDPDARYLLFGLLAFAGEWERAAKQLDALALNDPVLQQRTGIYLNLIAAEMDRAAALTGKTRPLLPPETPEHAQLRLDAFVALAAGDSNGAERAIDAAVAAAPSVVGTCNGTAFGALRDLDDRFGSVLEVFAGGHYLWLPLERIRRLEIEPPAHLLDTIWLPAGLEDSDGTTATIHLPVLYPGSASSEDEAERLGRKTGWVPVTPELFAGSGQRILAHAAEGEPEEVPLLDLRTLEIAGG
jgi:type VI secretion system protein ImpE